MIGREIDTDEARNGFLPADFSVQTGKCHDGDEQQAAADTGVLQDLQNSGRRHARELDLGPIGSAFAQ